MASVPTTKRHRTLGYGKFRLGIAAKTTLLILPNGFDDPTLLQSSLDVSLTLLLYIPNERSYHVQGLTIQLVDCLFGHYSHRKCRSIWCRLQPIIGLWVTMRRRPYICIEMLIPYFTAHPASTSQMVPSSTSPKWKGVQHTST